MALMCMALICVASACVAFAWVALARIQIADCRRRVRVSGKPGAAQPAFAVQRVLFNAASVHQGQTIAALRRPMAALGRFAIVRCGGGQ